jgi:hypothetical protein
MSQPPQVLEYRTSRPGAPTGRARSEFAWVGWAAFLAVSWTWCIGMFLPVLLMRDYGSPGWWVFAVPNVVGAALMGWVLRAPESSAAIVAAHRDTGIAFSVTTIAFHLFFAGWLIRSWWHGPALAVVVFVSVLLLALIVMLARADRWISFLALLVSAFCFAQEWDAHDLSLQLLHFKRPDATDLLWLAPVSAFGFALCPYLDLTFHRARQAARDFDDARAAFSFGFGVFFLSMIAFTALYAAPMWYLLKDGYFGLSDSVIRLVTIHLVLQSAVTVAFHAREVLQRARQIPLLNRGMSGLVLVGAAVVGAQASNHSGLGEMDRGERIYRLFMAFYGLVFPAYVWLCMMPGRGRVAPTRRQWVVWMIVVFVVAPTFWLGFIERRMIWLLPGLGVVLTARLFVPRMKTPSAADATGGSEVDAGADH